MKCKNVQQIYANDQTIVGYTMGSWAVLRYNLQVPGNLRESKWNPPKQALVWTHRYPQLGGMDHQEIPSKNSPFLCRKDWLPAPTAPGLLAPVLTVNTMYVSTLTRPWEALEAWCRAHVHALGPCTESQTPRIKCEAEVPASRLIVPAGDPLPLTWNRKWWLPVSKSESEDRTSTQENYHVILRGKCKSCTLPASPVFLDRGLPCLLYSSASRWTRSLTLFP